MLRWSKELEAAMRADLDSASTEELEAADALYKRFVASRDPEDVLDEARDTREEGDHED